ncbi:hypothetical protein [Rhodococcus sp. IEGM 1318]|uniref:hypothetical protein n=1 Tax=Rhodococcus sp. IEGM 1318 TaxID=3082226 RepID=UPI00295460D8|nr:hypothetical protein [Rhodococcus sp. IEGM 1318]MDV8006780.1 hypothetical protein [Rhodococcus sp. IEGM 1318]
MPESTTEPLTGPPKFFRPDQLTPTGDSTRKPNPGLNARRRLHKDLMHALDRVVRHVNRLGLEDEEKMLVEWAITYHTLDQRLAAATVKFEQQLDLEVPVPRTVFRGGVIPASAATSTAAREMLERINRPDWNPSAVRGAER